MGVMMQAIYITLPATLNGQAIERLSRELDDAGERPLVLGGTDNAFCRGLDLTGLLDSDAQALRVQAAHFISCLENIRQHPAPTLAVVKADALGGGLALAAVCDVVLADNTARFGLPELLYGFVPGFILPFLLTRMTAQAVRRLCIAGEACGVSLALQLGLVDQQVDEDMDSAVAGWIRNMLRIDRRALKHLRQLLKSRDKHHAAWEQACLETSLDLLSNESNQKALRDFIEEGIPPWGQRR